jgi:hypothetical protein
MVCSAVSFVARTNEQRDKKWLYLLQELHLVFVFLFLFLLIRLVKGVYPRANTQAKAKRKGFLLAKSLGQKKRLLVKAFSGLGQERLPKAKRSRKAGANLKRDDHRDEVAARIDVDGDAAGGLNVSKCHIDAVQNHPRQQEHKQLAGVHNTKNDKSRSSQDVNAVRDLHFSYSLSRT